MPALRKSGSLTSSGTGFRRNAIFGGWLEIENTLSRVSVRRLICLVVLDRVSRGAGQERSALVRQSC